MRKILSVLFAIWFYTVSIVLVLLGQPLALVAPSALPWYGRLWARMTMLSMQVCGMKWSVTGLENLPASGPMLIASMHQSTFDTLLWFRLVPRVRYIVKAELMRIPLFGWLARLTGQIGVDRGGGSATMRTLLHDGGAALAAGHQVVIFPEGTRSPPGTILPLHPGVAALAKRSGLGVIPVVTDSGWCWSKGLFGKSPGIIHVKIMTPLPAGLPRPALMQALADAFDAGTASLNAQYHNGPHHNDPHHPVDKSVNAAAARLHS